VTNDWVVGPPEVPRWGAKMGDFTLSLREARTPFTADRHVDSVHEQPEAPNPSSCRWLEWAVAFVFAVGLIFALGAVMGRPSVDMDCGLVSTIGAAI
jgi:hypothetical protein